MPLDFSNLNSPQTLKYVYFLCGSLSWYILYVLEEMLISYLMFLCAEGPEADCWKNTELIYQQPEGSYFLSVNGSGITNTVLQIQWHSVLITKSMK